MRKEAKNPTIETRILQTAQKMQECLQNVNIGDLRQFPDEGFGQEDGGLKSGGGGFDGIFLGNRLKIKRSKKAMDALLSAMK